MNRHLLLAESGNDQTLASLVMIAIFLGMPEMLHKKLWYSVFCQLQPSDYFSSFSTLMQVVLRHTYF